MRVAWFGTLLIGAALLIAGCRGGNSSGLPSLTAPGNASLVARAASTPPPGSGTLVVVLPAIVPSAPLPKPGAPGTFLLSNGTRSVSGTYGNVTFGPIDISLGSKYCVTSSGARTCTIAVPVPSGTKDLRLTTSGAKVSFGPLAFVGKTRVLVRPGVLNYAPPLHWFGIAHKIKITAAPRALTQFKPSQSILTVYGIDGSGSPIPDSVLFDASLSGFSTKTVATGAYKQSPTVKNFTPYSWMYDGRFAGTETFTTTAYVRQKPVAVSSVTVNIATGSSSSVGQILAATESFAGSSDISIVEFNSTAVGNQAPLRTLTNGAVPYGAQADGDFWMSAAEYDTIGDVLGRIAPPKNGLNLSASAIDTAQNEYGAYVAGANANCGASLNIYAFAPNSYGKTVTRDIVSTKGCSASELAVDGTGVLYAYVPPNYYGKSTGTVYEFAPNTSGNVPPFRTISGVFLQNIVADAAGNLYALSASTASASPSTIVKFASGATTSKIVLPAVNVAAFALDSHGNIYAEVPTTATSFQIEEFLSGSTTATRIIAGSKTTLSLPAGIAVLP